MVCLFALTYGGQAAEQPAPRKRTPLRVNPEVQVKQPIIATVKSCAAATVLTNPYVGKILFRARRTSGALGTNFWSEGRRQRAVGGGRL